MLSSKCTKCHTNGIFKGDLSLETREQLVDSGTVEKDRLPDSDLMAPITSDDPDFQMPPEGARLTPSEVAAIGRWIDEGLDSARRVVTQTKAFGHL